MEVEHLPNLTVYLYEDTFTSYIKYKLYEIQANDNLIQFHLIKVLSDSSFKHICMTTEIYDIYFSQICSLGFPSFNGFSYSHLPKLF